MSQPSRSRSEFFHRVRSAGRASVLFQLSPGATDLVIWRREPPASVGELLDGLDPDQLPNVRIDTNVDSLGAAIGGETWTPACSWVRNDIPRLAARFAAITGEAHLSVRLQPVGSDACRFLHHDYVAHRLVCTYRGRGTQWLPPEREGDVADRRHGVDPGLLKHVPRFAVAMFTGRTCPNATPILHRSPPIGASGEVRLVLTIDIANPNENLVQL